MTSQEDPHSAEQPPVDPARALDELEERVLGRTADPDPAARDEWRTDSADDTDTEPDPVDGDSGTGVDQEPAD